MAERLKAPVLKTGNAQAFVGSNPTLSAIFGPRWADPAGPQSGWKGAGGPDTIQVGNLDRSPYPPGPRGEVAEWLKARPC